MSKEKACNCNNIITEYIVEKVRNGYELSCTSEELMEVLEMATSFVDVNTKNFCDAVERYIEGNASKRKVWSVRQGDFVYNPIVKRTESGLIIPTYDLSRPSQSVMDYALSQYLTEFMKRNCEKRKVDETISIDYQTTQFSQSAAAALVCDIWSKKIGRLIENGRWPIQCTDIKEFLIDQDLASIIKESPMREDLLNFYFDVANRIALLSVKDYNFRMTNYDNEVLAKANFDFVIDGYSYYRTVDGRSEAVVVDHWDYVIENIIDRYDGNTKRTKLEDPKVLKLVKDLNATRPSDTK